MYICNHKKQLKMDRQIKKIKIKSLLKNKELELEDIVKHYKNMINEEKDNDELAKLLLSFYNTLVEEQIEIAYLKNDLKKL